MAGRPTPPDDLPAAEAAAVRILTAAAQTEAGLRRKLEQRGFSGATARSAAAAMAGRGFVDDDAYAGALADRRFRAGHGRARVAAELRARGVAERPIERALGTTGMEDEREAALRAARALLATDRGASRGRSPAARLAARLSRRGFDAETVLFALRRVGAAGDRDGGDLTPPSAEDAC